VGAATVGAEVEDAGGEHALNAKVDSSKVRFIAA
jgi:hypothetical protein